MSIPLRELFGNRPPPEWEPEGTISFSVIVRTQGRRPNSLRAAVESLAAQSHQNLEILVMVHDDDPQKAHEVAQQLDGASAPSPLTVTAVTGPGRSAPLNAGLALASKDYICFLDDDDLANPEWLSSFDSAIRQHPETIIRARVASQAWTTDGGDEPVRPTGAVEEPFAPTFDLLAHVSQNQTPICGIAVPRHLIEWAGATFNPNLSVLEDWDFLMQMAPICGVTSIDACTSIYRRLDDANADTAESVSEWERAHAMVIDAMSKRPLLLPPGDARRVAGAHFVAGLGSRHEQDLQAASTEIDQITRSPLTWLRRFVARLAGAVGHRIEERRQ